MPIFSMGCFFFAFAAAGGLSQLHLKLRTPTWLIVAMTPVLVGLYWVTMKAMPFHGPLTEIPIVLLAAVAGSGPIAIMHRANEELKAKREEAAKGHAAEFKGGAKTSRSEVTLTGMLFMALFLPTMAITQFSLVSRINYASWLRWSCDGTVVAVTRDKGNHNTPMVLVESDGRTETFSTVDGAFWAQAKPGMHLTKSAGSPMAWLDGKLVRMSPKQVEWWNDAK